MTILTFTHYYDGVCPFTDSIIVGLELIGHSVPVRLGMQIANVKLRQILPRVGKIWVSTPQNRTYCGRKYLFIFTIQLKILTRHRHHPNL